MVDLRADFPADDAAVHDDIGRGFALGEQPIAKGFAQLGVTGHFRHQLGDDPAAVIADGISERGDEGQHVHTERAGVGNGHGLLGDRRDRVHDQGDLGGPAAVDRGFAGFRPGGHPVHGDAVIPNFGE